MFQGKLKVEIVDSTYTVQCAPEMMVDQCYSMQVDKSYLFSTYSFLLVGDSQQ